MEYFKLEKPGKTYDIFEINAELQKLDHPNIIPTLADATTSPKYLYWDKVKYKTRPKEFTPELFWSIVKLLRSLSPSRTATSVLDMSGKYYYWQRLPRFEEFAHQVDMNLGGRLESHIPDSPAEKQRYITIGIMEEAIASSQLEGANTERKYAKRMLQENRKARNKYDQMIINNYRAMKQIEESLRDREMSAELLLELHATLTKDTLDVKDIGRFRKASDDIVVDDPSTHVIFHEAPPVNFLKKELKRLVDYANDKLTPKVFEHPVFKAIVLHFWIAYLHPFVDGNGRVARALFYWYMLRKGYWAISYLPISRVIKQSPAQYRDAYIYSEQDDCDLTYFIDYNVAKIQQARREFDSYVKRKQSEQKALVQLTVGQYGFNDRQIQLLRYLEKNLKGTTSIAAHAEIYNVTRMTARRDLEQLERLGFLTSHKLGRTRPFSATDKLNELFKSTRS